MPSSPGMPEEQPRAHQEDERVGAGNQVIHHDAETAAKSLALARGKRLPDVEDAEEEKGRAEDRERAGQEHHGDHHAGDLVDHDEPGVLATGHGLDTVSGPDAE